MMEYKMLDGNGAAVQAVSMAGVKVVSAYPITPQSPIAEKLSELIATGKMDAKYIRVESEHSALSCALGAQLTGVRAATATASVGLALMHEICNAVSGMRIPLVMPVVNRALASPWSLWCDHQDSMAERDSGWLQFYCENVQEVYDLLLLAYRVAEHRRVLLPVMVCFDGFFLSHSMQKVQIPAQEAVSAFVGTYEKKNFWLDAADPIFVNDLISMEEFTEMKYQMMKGFEAAKEVFKEAADDFSKQFGRGYEMAEGYRSEDAEILFIGMGSLMGTTKYFVDQLRKQGEKVGAIKITSFRPFPTEDIRQLAANAKKIAVFDRSAGLGAAGGPLYQEIAAAFAGTDVMVRNYIGGLGGRDVNLNTIEKMYADVRDASDRCGQPIWIDVKDHPMEIREVMRHV